MEEQTRKINPWLLIALGVVIVGGAVFFYLNSRTSVETDIIVTPPTVTTSPTVTNTEELNNINSDLENLDNDLNQLDKIDPAADEDITPTL